MTAVFSVIPAKAGMTNFRISEFPDGKRISMRHKSTRITTHYSQAELENLIATANKVWGQIVRKMLTLVVMKKQIRHQGLPKVADS